MSFKRKVYNELLNWKSESNGSTAILLEGARRIGKSFIAEEFAKNEYKSYLIVDFSIVDERTKNIFLNSSRDLNMFFLELEVEYNTKLFERESLIIFDEIQLFPYARQLIKHLVADGRYDYIETGSLLSIKTNVQDILIPSEERSIKMKPLDFEEFLWATNDNVTYDAIKKFYDEKKPLGDTLHRTIMKRFRTYMLIGGMPQAILEYNESKDFSKVESIKRDIITLYRNDVVKFARGYEQSVLNIFDNIASELSKPYKRYNLSSINKNARFRNYEDSFIWLEEAGIVNVCYNNRDPNVGLGMNLDNRAFKLYMADTGLLITMSLNDNPYYDSKIYKSLLSGNLRINEGMFAENIVAQSLVGSNHRLFFYINRDKINRENNMEIDFLVSSSNKLLPIEVKSGKYNAHSSIDKFKIKYSKRTKEKIILHTKDLKIDGENIYLPLYMASLIK